jgi:RNA polymerase sigma-70 factor (ECF subfamily)
MMRITRSLTGTTLRLRVEGRVTKENVMHLESACDASRSGERGLLLDLSGVRFVDGEGARALQEASARGAVLVGCTPFVSEVLREDGRSAGDGHTEETGLVARLRSGDAAAFEQLVRRHGPRMLATARRLLGNEPDARDAVQEALLSAWRSIGDFAGGARLSTWLHRIAMNAALMRMRRRRRRPEESIDDLLPRFDADGHRVDDVASVAEPAEAIVERAETRAMVRRAIERLPESYRTVLVLRDIEELDTEDAAAVLGVSTNALKTRLHRARQALRTLIAHELAGTASR